MSQKSLFSKYFKLFPIISTMVVVVIFASFDAGVAQVHDLPFEDAKSVRSSLISTVSLSSALSAGGAYDLKEQNVLKVFYAGRQNKPYWIDEFKVNKQARELLEVLESSWKHGLNPDNYHVRELRSSLNMGRLLKGASLELLLSDAFIHYVRDISGMRINPEALGWGAQGWVQPMKGSAILALLSTGQNMKAILEGLAPQSATYRRLQEELVRLVAQPEEDYASLLPLDFGGALVRPGERYSAIPSLRARLGVKMRPHDAHLYDDHLAGAVIAFQKEKGLHPDALIGANTLQALNRTKRERILQIIANLERIRWVSPERPERFVVVNIPSATLWAVDEGAVQFEMPVIVGKVERQTPSFITKISGVRLNPDWTIPPTIKREDIWPKLKENPEYLFDKGIEVFSGYGRESVTLDPQAIDWKNLKPSELHGLRMVQIPGEHNPLGRVRILMPNKYNVYLHDTNHPEGFSKARRMLSSGCVRMKEPEKMAAFIMKGSAHWSSDLVNNVLKVGEKKDFRASSTVAIYILYYTTWIDEHNRVVFGADVYEKDSKLIALLEKVDGIYIPVHNESDMVRSGRSQVVSMQ